MNNDAFAHENKIMEAAFEGSRVNLQRKSDHEMVMHGRLTKRQQAGRRR